MTVTANHYRDPHTLSDGQCYCNCDACSDENGACICPQCQNTTEHPRAGGD